MSVPSNPAIIRALQRRSGSGGWAGIRSALVLAVFVLFIVAGCASTGESVPAPGDPAGITTATGANLDGLAPGSIADGDYEAAKTSEPYAAKLADLVDENRLAVNFVWLLVTGFLVMFMQAGFALVETGFTRAKNAMHTMSMNFMVYAIGIVGFFFVGFGLAFGGLGTVGVGNLGGLAPLSNEIGITIGDTTWGIAGGTGFALSGSAYDVGVIAFFLFQLVFMDTTATIPTGSMAERWRFKPFVVYGLFISAILYPLYANWAWGGGFLSQLGSIGLGNGYVDFAGSGVVHSIGGWAALAGAIVLGPRIGKFNKDGSSNTILGHNQILALLGHVHPRLRLVRVQPGVDVRGGGQRCAADRHRRRRDDAGVRASGRSPRWSTRGGPRASRTRP